MNYKKYGIQIFDFYDVDFLDTVRDELSNSQLQMLDKQLVDTKCTNVWDVTFYKVGEPVTCRYGNGTITDWHLTDIGKINGGYQVELDNGKLVNLYVTQITRNKSRKSLAQSNQPCHNVHIDNKQTFNLNIPF